ncbi:MAG TPA: radical SAM protein [Bacteroidia bacterium]|jgi:uncharacterized protein|nr:radical SAM protein [Bacteroidia bacterium]
MKYSQFNSTLPYEGKTALFNSFSQQVIFLENELHDILKAAIHEGIDGLEQVHPEFYSYLVENAFIVESNVDEIDKVRKLSKEVDEDETKYILTINPTMNCNFKCYYCYETHVKDSKMDEIRVDSINKFITQTLSREKMQHFAVSFFGGEPLLYFKKNVIPIINHLKWASEEKKKAFSVTFTTNGFLVNDEFIHYFKSNDLFATLQITLDGYREEHDKVRFVTKTKGSYDEIVKNIRTLLLADNFNIILRINFTEKNIQSCTKIVDDFVDIPKEIRDRRLVVDYHRVWQDYNPTDTANAGLDETEEKLKEHGFKTGGMYSPDNVRNSCYADKRNSATINYNGDVFKCTARDFLTKNRVGYITEAGELVWENDHLNVRMQAKMKNKPCQTCRIMPLCNGGCSQHAIENAGYDYCVYQGDENEKSRVVLTKIEEIVQQMQASN